MPCVHVTLSFRISEFDGDPDELKQEMRRELDRVGFQREIGRISGSDGGMLEASLEKDLKMIGSQLRRIRLPIKMLL